MKPFKILLLSSLLLVGTSFAKVTPKIPVIAGGRIDSLSAEQAFERYACLLAEYRTDVSRPNGFATIKTPNNRIIPYTFSYPNNNVRLFYDLGFKADNDEALIMLPVIFFDFGNFTIRQGDEIQRELRSVYKDDLLDVNDLVDIIDVKGKEGYANADTIAIYEFDLKTAASPYADEYSKCIGIYLRSKYHPCLMLKILLTDKGYAKKDEYIHILLDNVTYGEFSPMLLMLEKDLDHIFSDFGFETKENNPNLHRLSEVLND